MRARRCRASRRGRVAVDLERAAFTVLEVVDRPHRAFHVLHPHKALVQAQIVSHRVLKIPTRVTLIMTALSTNQHIYLPSLSVLSKIAEIELEPFINLV